MNSDILLYCPECDTRPFKVTQADLNDAEGVIECEYCGGDCEEVPPGEDVIMRQTGAPMLPGME